MSTSLLLQYLIIGLVVMASLLTVVRKLAPRLTSRWLAAASIELRKPGRATWARSLGRWLQPAQGTGDCSDGCSTCGSCGPKPPAAAQLPEPMPLDFRTRQ